LSSPEQRARIEIDRLLVAAGWLVQDLGAVNLHAARGVAVREFPLNPGHGKADYLLYVDQKACGVIEAKKQGHLYREVLSDLREHTHNRPRTRESLERFVATKIGPGAATDLVAKVVDHLFAMGRVELKGKRLEYTIGQVAATPQRRATPPANSVSAPNLK
jgi:hypothetical protein